MGFIVPKPWIRSPTWKIGCWTPVGAQSMLHRLHNCKGKDQLYCKKNSNVGSFIYLDNTNRRSDKFVRVNKLTMDWISVLVQPVFCSERTVTDKITIQQQRLKDIMPVGKHSGKFLVILQYRNTTYTQYSETCLEAHAVQHLMFFVCIPLLTSTHLHSKHLHFSKKGFFGMSATNHTV